MSWSENIFHTKKPIIGLLHLLSLPGDPFYGGSMEEVVRRAKEDLVSLQDGGVDGFLITNEFSMPYSQKAGVLTCAAMTRVFGEIAHLIRVPFGIEAIHDGPSCMKLCAVTGASFTRCLFTGAWSSDLGLHVHDIAETLRVRHELRLDHLNLCYFINGEGSTCLDTRSLADKAKSMLFQCRPEAFVVAGSMAGHEPDTRQISTVKEISGDRAPVLCGTGFNYDNSEAILSVADGAFVGSAIKKDSIFTNPIDQARVERLMEKVRAYREGL